MIAVGRGFFGPSGPPALGGLALKVFEPNQFLRLLVPQPQRNTFQAGEQRDGVHLLELRVLVVALLQRVVGDARAEVMNVVQADIAGEPPQQPGQLEIGAAAQSSRGEIPVGAVLPIGILKLVLNVKQPDADGAGQDSDGQLHQDHFPETAEVAQDHERGQDRQVCEMNAPQLAPPDARRWKALGDDEQQYGRDDKQADGMPIGPVERLLPRGQRQVFFDGIGQGHVPGGAAIEVAGGGVMDGVVMAPLEIGGERHDAADTAQEIVRLLRRKE